MIELDVRRTADQELVIFHDNRVGRERVGSLSHDSLCARSGTDVPRLTDVYWAS